MDGWGGGWSARVIRERISREERRGRGGEGTGGEGGVGDQRRRYCSLGEVGEAPKVMRREWVVVVVRRESSDVRREVIERRLLVEAERWGGGSEEAWSRRAGVMRSGICPRA